MPIDPRLVAWEQAIEAGPAIDPAAVQWEHPKPGGLRDFEPYRRAQNYSGKDSAGALSGLASIGSTLLGMFEGKDANEARRADTDKALVTLTGADPASREYQTNRLLGQVAATWPVGGALGATLRMIPGAAKALPTLIPAIESAGMAAPGAKGTYAAANRVAGGGTTGAATAGILEPDNAGAGAVIGGVLPPMLQGAARVAEAASTRLGSNAINPQLQKTGRESIDAGYVIPPSSISPSASGSVLESISGKQATQQVASVKNAATSEQLVRGALGIPADIPLTKATLEELRKTAGVAYQQVAEISPQAAADLEALKQARNDAQAWFKSYNRSASPADLAKAKEYRDTAVNLESWLEYHAIEAGKPELIPKLAEARRAIAKTYTVERALNDAAGTIDARVLGRMYEKGMPLSDGLETVGKFASAFPTVAKTPQQIGSPATHNIKALAALAMGSGGAGAGAGFGLGMMGSGGVGLTLAALPFIAPPLARMALLSKPMQRGLLDASPGALSESIDALTPLMYRAPSLLTSSGGPAS